jgi:hypothetical protein
MVQTRLVPELRLRSRARVSQGVTTMQPYKFVVFVLFCAGALSIGIVGGSIGGWQSTVLLALAYFLGGGPGTLAVLMWKPNPPKVTDQIR